MQLFKTLRYKLEKTMNLQNYNVLHIKSYICIDMCKDKLKRIITVNFNQDKLR